MRNVIMIFFCFCFSYANAQDSSTALLTDGKVWHCVDAWLEEGSKIERNFSITVCGDTTVENRHCKKLCMVYEDSPLEKKYFPMYEEGTRIYDFVPDTLQYGKQQLRLLLDFGLKVGDKAFRWDDDREVIREDVISVKGHTYKRLTINTKDKSGEDIYWVESIGASNDFFITMIEKPTGYSLYKNMVSCYDKNGVCLFEREDFSTAGAAGVAVVESGTKHSSSKIYDLTGKRVDNPRKGEIYIKDGVKYVE